MINKYNNLYICICIYKIKIDIYSNGRYIFKGVGLFRLFGIFLWLNMLSFIEFILLSLLLIFIFVIVF